MHILLVKEIYGQIKKEINKYSVVMIHNSSQ
jgi:hypothetical protein